MYCKFCGKQLEDDAMICTGAEGLRATDKNLSSLLPEALPFPYKMRRKRLNLQKAL